MIWINDMEEQWLDRGACPNPECGSSDANVNHSEGYSFCYSCWTRFGEKGNKMETENIIPMKTDNNASKSSKRCVRISGTKIKIFFAHW